MDFAIPADHRLKIKQEQKERQIRGPRKRTKQSAKCESNGYTTCN